MIDRAKHTEAPALRTDPRLAGTVTLDTFREFLCSTELSGDLVRIARLGKGVEAERYCTTKVVGKNAGLYVNGEQAWEFFEAGYSIVMGQAHKRWDVVHEISRQLGHSPDELGRVAVYATPAGSQGWLAHYDSEDALAVQTDGEKRWEVFAWPQRPQTQDLPKFFALSPHLQEEVRKTVRKSATIYLSSGQQLYVPGGTVHAVATEEQPSVHITFRYRNIETDLRMES